MQENENNEDLMKGEICHSEDYRGLILLIRVSPQILELKNIFNKL